MTTLEAPHGEKTIEISIRLHTDKIADEPNHIVPKHAWDSGFVTIVANKSHGIKKLEDKNTTLPFNSLLELGNKIEDLLIMHGITLHASRARSGKYRQVA
jgi:hypothetical protein